MNWPNTMRTTRCSHMLLKTNEGGFKQHQAGPEHSTPVPVQTHVASHRRLRSLEPVPVTQYSYANGNLPALACYEVLRIYEYVLQSGAEFITEAKIR